MEITKCAICGKQISPFQYNLRDYAYRDCNKYYCSYSHLREALKEKEERTGKRKRKNCIKR